MIYLVWTAGLLACSERPSLGDTTQGTDTSTSGDQTSGAPTTGVTDSAPSTGGPGGGSTDDTTTSESPSTGTVSTSSTTSADDTCGFLCGSDTDMETDTPTVDCDPFTQDCPEGQKCAPYAEGPGSSWNALKCVPVTGAGQTGDPCVDPEGLASGLDDCAKGFLCWDTDEQNVGTCIEMCGGNSSAPSCTDDEAFSCAIGSEGVVNLCISYCDPLAPDCPNANLCVPLMDHFLCVVDASGAEGQVFDPCEFINACDPGLFCAPPEAASECPQDATGCCLPYCDLSDPDPGCPGAQQVCVPFYEEGTAPELYKDLGLCTLMP